MRWFLKMLPDCVVEGGTMGAVMHLDDLSHVFRGADLDAVVGLIPVDRRSPRPNVLQKHIIKLSTCLTVILDENVS